MRKTMGRTTALAVAACAATPLALAAHEGHGVHGWLQGALQPLLSVDHLLAGLTVLAVGGVAFAMLGRAVAARRGTPEDERRA